MKEETIKSKKSNHPYLRKAKVQKITDDIDYELFKIKKYAQNVNYPDNDLLLLLGCSGEGKSVFALQFLMQFVEKNFIQQLKTNIWVLSQTEDAKNMLNVLVNTMQSLFPTFNKKFNDKDNVITIGHTKDIEDLKKELDYLIDKKDSTEHKTTQFIFFLDDVGTILTSLKKKIKDFFDILASNGRHYNIITIINSQRIFGLSKTLVGQIGTAVFVGKITESDWDYIMKNGTFHSLCKKKYLQLFEKYFNEIGLKGSRNILIFQKKDPKTVFLQKVSEKFLSLIKESS